MPLAIPCAERFAHSTIALYGGEGTFVTTLPNTDMFLAVGKALRNLGCRVDSDAVLMVHRVTVPIAVHLLHVQPRENR